MSENIEENKQVDNSSQYQTIVQELSQLINQHESHSVTETTSQKSDNSSDKQAKESSPTGVKEFDRILNGGFPKGAVILLAGSSGSGKTIFSFQWLFEGVKHDENGLYITLTEPIFKILENLEKMSYYDREAVEQEKLKIIDLRNVFAGKGHNPKAIIEYIAEEVKQTHAKRLCIDSITAIAYQYNEKHQIRSFIFELGKTLAILGCTTILTSEVSEQNKYSVYDVEEFISDAIIRLDQIKVRDENQRVMQIVKIRGKSYNSEELPLKISQDGIHIFPKIKSPLEYKSTNEKISTGNSMLDEMLMGGIIQGSSTLIAGSTGTGKTVLSLQFIMEGLRNDEPCFYVGFEESKDQLLRNAKSFGWDLEAYENKGRLTIQSVYPSDKLLEEHFTDIKKIVEIKNIKRCVIDSLSALSNNFEEGKFTSFTVRLNGFLKSHNVTTFFTATTAAVIGSPNLGESRLSSVTDNILMLRYVEMQGKLESVINILKMRGSSHRKDLRRYEITDQGVVIGESLSNYEGIMTGVSKKIAELKKESEELKKALKEKQDAEDALKESKKEVEDILNAAADGIRIVGKDFRIKTMNQTMARMTGVSVENAIGSLCRDVFKAEGFCQTKKCSLIKVLETGEGFTREGIRIRQDGKKIPTLEVVSPYKDEHGNIIGIIEDIRDITDLKKAESALKESEERLRDLFNNVNDMIQSVDANGNFLYVNKSWLEILGYTEEEVKNLTLFDILREDQIPHCQEVIRRLSEGESFEMVETVFVSKDGREIYVEGSVNGKVENGKLVATRAIFRDVTQQKKMEAELIKSERKYRTIVSSMSDLLFLIDKDDRFRDVYCSSDFPLYKQPEEFLGKSIQEVLPPEVSKPYSEVTKRVRETGRSENYEYPLDINGERRWFEATLDLHEDGESIVARVREITDRKRMEEELKNSKKRFEDIAFSSADFIWEVDANGRYTFAAGRIQDILGYSSEEIIGKTLFELMPEDEAEKMRETFQKIASEKKPLVDIENWSLTKDGKKVCLLTNGIPMLDEDGTLLGYRGVDKDITERKAAEERIKEYNSRFEKLFNSMIDPVVIVDSTGKFLEISDNVEKITGFKKDELLGKNFLKTNIVTHKSKLILMKNLAKRMAGMKIEPYEIEVLTKDGRKIPFELNAAVIEYNDKPADMVVLRDISERKQSEETLEIVIKELERKVKERTAEIEKNERKYRTLIEHLPQKIFQKNRNLVYTYVNENYAHSLRLTPEKIIGKTDYDLYPPEVAEKYSDADRKILEKGKIEKFTETRLIDGKEVEVHMIKIPLADDKGNIDGLLGIFWESNEDLFENNESEPRLNKKILWSLKK